MLVKSNNKPHNERSSDLMYVIVTVWYGSQADILSRGKEILKLFGEVAFNRAPAVSRVNYLNRVKSLTLFELKPQLKDNKTGVVQDANMPKCKT